MKTLYSLLAWSFFLLITNNAIARAFGLLNDSGGIARGDSWMRGYGGGVWSPIFIIATFFLVTRLVFPRMSK